MAHRSSKMILGATMSFAAGVMSASALPIFHGYELGHSFRQSWELKNGHENGESRGSFNKVVVQLVSQKNKETREETQHVFEQIEVKNYREPESSWHTTSPINIEVNHGEGEGNEHEAVLAEITFHGDEHDECDFRLVYFQGEECKGGYDIHIDGDGSNGSCNELGSDLQSVPLPGGAAMASLGLVLVGAHRRRN